jgi:hypothetical protein
MELIFLNKKNSTVFLYAVLLIAFLIAFINAYRTVTNITWAFDYDFQRDMSFVQSILDGNYSKDPSYSGEFWWYNPLLSWIEAGLVKISGISVPLMLTKAGIYLNLLAPLTFFILMSFFFTTIEALCGTIAMLFFTAGNLPGWAAATYSPWLFPVCFMQSVFYISLIVLYKYFKTSGTVWVFALGICSGICFLGHAAPALLLLILTVSLSCIKLYSLIINKKREEIFRLIKNSLIYSVSFIVVSLPLLRTIIGKYHMKTINRDGFEYLEPMFQPGNMLDLIKANISLTLVFSIVGFYYFIKYYHKDEWIRKIILLWGISTLALFIYTTMVVTLRYKMNIWLPGIVPSFHFFFYLKALQPVFFSFGFIWIARMVFQKLSSDEIHGTVLFSWIAPSIMLGSVFFNYPAYSKNFDFNEEKILSLTKSNQTNAIDARSWIVENLPADDVILCEESTSVFPLLSTGRKLVAVSTTMSNPYVDFKRRHLDRTRMLVSLMKNDSSSEILLKNYHVDYLFLNKVRENLYKKNPLLVKVNSFHNKDFVLYKIQF